MLLQPRLFGQGWLQPFGQLVLSFRGKLCSVLQWALLPRWAVTPAHAAYTSFATYTFASFAAKSAWRELANS